MRNKRSTGITLFAISLLYFPIIQLIVFTQYCIFALKIGSPASTLFNSLSGRPFGEIMFFAIFIIISIGLLRLRIWSYYFVLAIAYLFISLKLDNLLSMVRYVYSGGEFWFLGIAEPAIYLLYFITLIIFFNRSEVKKQFK